VSESERDWVEGVDPQVARALRRLWGMERLRLAHEASELACERLAAYFAALHPAWSREEIPLGGRGLGDGVRKQAE
jgi:hypothetical protein